MEFKKGMKVNYNTGTNSGTGMIVGIRQCTRGVFYEVEDANTKKVYALRGAKLSVA